MIILNINFFFLLELSCLSFKVFYKIHITTIKEKKKIYIYIYIYSELFWSVITNSFKRKVL